MHIMYVDESGDDGFCASNKYDNHGASKFFVRIGFIIHESKWRSINTWMNDFRLARSISDRVEIHASEFLNGRSKKLKSAEDFFITQYKTREERIEFLEELCKFISNLNATIICVIIDKQKITPDVPDYRNMPKNMSWKLLVERYNLYLNGQSNKIGITISDSGDKYTETNHRNLIKSMLDTSMHIRPNQFVESILFEPSESSNLLQLADIVAFAFGRYYNSNDSTFYQHLENKIFIKNGNREGAGLKIWP